MPAEASSPRPAELKIDELRVVTETNRAARLPFPEASADRLAPAPVAIEQQLRASEAILRTFCDSSPLLMGLVEVCEGDSDLLHVYGNPAADAFFGVAPGGTVGKRASELGAPPEHIARWIAQYRAAERQGGTVRFEYPHETDQGVHWLACVVARVVESVSQRPRFSFVAADVTDRKRTELALREARTDLERHAAQLERTVEQRTAELRSANAEMETVLYSVAHDLRAPLRSMAGFSELIQSEYAGHLPAEARQMLGRINSAAQLMDRLVHDLLEFGRAARAEVQLQRTSVAEAWRVACFQCAAAITQSGGTIEAATPLPDVIAHAPTLTQILTNLLSNALKFGKPGAAPVVRLRAEPSGDRTRVIVEDEGIGIPPEHHARIFGLFDRLNPTVAEGTGVGLAIVRKGAAQEGGGFWRRIAARSRQPFLD
jgi:PAS domain S-box-containing protein